MTAGSPNGRPCVLIATDSADDARRAASRAGLYPSIVLFKADCARTLGDVRRAAAAGNVATTVVHSADWSRQTLPQLFELAAARLALPHTVLLDGAGQTPVGRRRLVVRAAAAPAEVLAGAALAGVESARLAAAGRRRSTFRRAQRSRDAVLAVWQGSPAISVGGSVTHIAGILGGFRSAGLEVHLITACDPPAQLAAVADEVEVLPALRPAARATTELAGICVNRPGRHAVSRYLARSRPRFVYQRYDPFIWYGVDAAERAGVPSVLEWNSSEVWTHSKWHVDHPLKQAFDPVLRGVERHVVRRAVLVAAVSARAATMARAAGADPRRLRVVPNGVDVAGIARALDGAPPPPAEGTSARVGWVGSFGSWHGAEVLVGALALLPPEIGATMIGDGPRLAASRSLAERLGVADRIEWTGILPHDEVVRRLAGCDVLASPHIPLEGGEPFFGSPTKLFEYMAIGRPIVASALEQIGEVLEDGRTARLTRPGDPEDLAQGLGGVLAREDRGRALGDAARREALAHHTWERRARAILDALAAAEAL